MMSYGVRLSQLEQDQEIVMFTGGRRHSYQYIRGYCDLMMYIYVLIGDLLLF